MKKIILAWPILAQAIAAGLLSLAYFDHHDTMIGWIALALSLGSVVSYFNWKDQCV